jgi:transposase
MGAGLGVRILGAERVHGKWVILAVGDGVGVCPDCRKQSERRHGWHERHLQDLPAQGAAVTVKLRIQRWQCRNKACKRQTFASHLPEIAAPLARRTARAAELISSLWPWRRRPARRTLIEALRHADQR